MQVNGQPHTTLNFDQHQQLVTIIDQTRLPHRFELCTLKTLDDFCFAISAMQVRGAPLIGITAAFGLALALLDDGSDHQAQQAYQRLLATRPTAVNLRWALDTLWQQLAKLPAAERGAAALKLAEQMRHEDIASCQAIGAQGLDLIQQVANKKPQGPVNILTHCNAGWLATIDWGTALAPIYKAQQAGIDLHIWVDETRPRNQGASLTAWELGQQGIHHTVIADNTGGYLMQQGQVDLCLVGSDRTSARGDVCNKIGTYLKALAAHDNDIPFYVALPCSTIDWQIEDGLRDIPIEQRDARELTHMQGLDETGQLREIQLWADSPAANYAFDVTPAKLITALITEHGVYEPNAMTELQKKVEAV